VAAIIGAAIIAANSHAIERGISELVRVLVVIAIAAVCMALAAVAVTVAVRMRRSAARLERAATATAALPVVIRRLGPAERPAIEPASWRIDQAAVTDTPSLARRSAGGHR